MQISNHVMRDFMNATVSMLSKKLPRKLFVAIHQNRTAMKGAADAFNDALKKIEEEYGAPKEGEVNPEVNKAFVELLNLESEIVIQTVPESLFDMMDESSKFDSLTGEEYAALEFMIQ